LRTLDPFVLRPNGAFSYGYVLTDGSYAYAENDAATDSSSAEVSGGYGYKADDGKVRAVTYTAGA